MIAGILLNANLEVNLSKSKVMILRRGGRRGEKRIMDIRDKIGIVNYYKFCGVGLTPQLSFTKYFKEKMGSAKFAIVSTYKNLLKKPQVPISSKFEMYNSLMRAIICYGAQS